MRGNVPATMKALVAYSAADYRFEQAFPVPECGPDDIIIKTEGCGICAGDLKCQHGAAMFWGDGSQPSWVEPPFVPADAGGDAEKLGGRKFSVLLQIMPQKK